MMVGMVTVTKRKRQMLALKQLFIYYYLIYSNKSNIIIVKHPKTLFFLFSCFLPIFIIITSSKIHITDIFAVESITHFLKSCPSLKRNPAQGSKRNTPSKRKIAWFRSPKVENGKDLIFPESPPRKNRWCLKKSISSCPAISPKTSAPSKLCNFFLMQHC